MVIGVPKEIKTDEFRVAVTPIGAKELKKDGHTVLIEEGAGRGCGIKDADYLDADADIIDRDTLFRNSDLIVKVKEPLPSEFGLIREGQAIFTYLHLAPNRLLTELLLNKKVTGIGYETLQKDGTLPLLAPMSEIAGRMAPIMAAYFLQKEHGGSGVLVTGATGASSGKVLIIGAGVVGTNSARVCVGLEMDTVVIDKRAEQLQRLENIFKGRIKTLLFSEQNIRKQIKDADIVIGAILVTGGKTPVLITKEMLKTMKKGSVIVDVSIDQGGCFETSRPTTHDNPTYEIDGIIHYTVSNMPGAYPCTSTAALTSATLPYIKILANTGIEKAIRENPEIKSGLNTYKGEIVLKPLAESMGMRYKDIEEIN
ncbi:MAG: alanine dehydrogenase [Nitrospirae bacterium GWC2_42_7]|nr:MAG: alanine dehydrogenase [Nitrospirae bacterium GWC2_42_7]